MMRKAVCVPLLLLLLAAGASAQDAAPPRESGRSPGPSRDTDRPKQPKPYKEVITAEAKSEPGLFTVHVLGDKVYYEIPPAALGREMLWSTEIAQLPVGYGYGGTAAGTHVVRWTRRTNRVDLREMS